MTRNRERRINPIIASFKPDMDKAFDKQAQKLNRAISRLQKDINPFDLEALWIANDIGEIIIEKADYWVRLSLEKGLEGAADVTGIVLEMNDSPRIINAADDILGKLKSMTDKTSIEDLRGLISESISSRDTVDQLKKKITERFTQYQGYRSERIARTESANAYGKASLEYYKECKIGYKKWQTMEDDRVSEICWGNQNEGTIPINQTFSSGVQNEPNHVNCRCSVIPVSEID
jgi:SPP1 gp7 family putative phage head morphogenesis protein